MKTKECVIKYHNGGVTLKLKISADENDLLLIIDSVVRTLISDGSIITEINIKHEIKE